MQTQQNALTNFQWQIMGHFFKIGRLENVQKSSHKEICRQKVILRSLGVQAWIVNYPSKGS